MVAGHFVEVVDFGQNCVFEFDTLGVESPAQHQFSRKLKTSVFAGNCKLRAPKADFWGVCRVELTVVVFAVGNLLAKTALKETFF